jgi:ribosomal protein S18 acetylase RimI-like enzyme
VAARSGPQSFEGRSVTGFVRLRIRPYRPTDRAAVAQCLGALQAHVVRLDVSGELVLRRGYAQQYTTMVFARVRERRGFVLVAETGGRVVGVVIATIPKIAREKVLERRPTRIGHIEDLAVRAAWRGKGIGSRLLARAERRLRAAGCDQLTIGVFARNRRAQALYERVGFQPWGVLLTKRIAPRPRAWASGSVLD